jgi:hypothetical protein
MAGNRVNLVPYPCVDEFRDRLRDGRGVLLFERPSGKFKTARREYREDNVRPVREVSQTFQAEM